MKKTILFLFLICFILFFDLSYVFADIVVIEGPPIIGTIAYKLRKLIQDKQYIIIIMFVIYSVALLVLAFLAYRKIREYYNSSNNLNKKDDDNVKSNL